MSTIDEPVGSLSLVEETAIDTGDTDFIFTRDQLEEMDYTLLRNMAKHADTDCVNGKSAKYVLFEYFGCQRSLTEYE